MDEQINQTKPNHTNTKVWTYHFHNSATCSKGHTGKVSYSTQAKVPVSILDRKHGLPLCRNNINNFFLLLLTDIGGNYTIISANFSTW
jgi:hypothetical protein